MSDSIFRRKVRVLGHKHPDTDSICSAIAYAWLKNQTDVGEYEARRAGPVNRETEFVLQYFGVEAPRLCVDISPQVKDIQFRTPEGISPETSLRNAWNRMGQDEIATLCVTGSRNELLGLIAVKDIANANMDLLDAGILSTSRTPYRNVIDTLDAQMLSGNPNGYIETGRIGIGTSIELMEQGIQRGDIVLVTDRYEAQSCAIDCGASCIIVCCGATVSDTMLTYAKERNCAVLTTPYNTYAAARLINTAAPVRHFMHTQNLSTVQLHTPLDDVKKLMALVRHRYFPVLNPAGEYCGMVSRRNLLNLEQKKVILVDHNEQTQAVDGLDQAEILEIIDHHRLGNLETNGPVYFRNVPVGSTATILYQMFQEQQIVPPTKIAGLLLSAILSDTLMFRSPTSTKIDRNAANALALLAGVDLFTYAEEMFEAGSNLQGRTAENLFFSDYKVFSFGGQYFGVGQTCFMSGRACIDAESMLASFLPDFRQKSNLPLVVYMITNMREQTTTLLYAGKNAEEILSTAFGKSPQNGRLILPGVVSRKKQLIPPLRTSLQKIYQIST